MGYSRIRIIGGGVAILIVVAISATLFRLNSSNGTRIVADDGASIEVKPYNSELEANKDEGFKRIGTGSATVDLGEKTIVRVSNGDRVSMLVTDHNETRESIEINLLEPSKAENLGTRALSHPMLSDGKLFGADPNTGQLVYEPVLNNDYPGFTFIGSPKANKIIWKDPENALGVFVGIGVAEVKAGLSSGLAGNSGETTKWLQVDSYENGPAYLLAKDGVYSSPSFSMSDTNLVDKGDWRDPSVFAFDGGFIIQDLEISLPEGGEAVTESIDKATYFVYAGSSSPTTVENIRQTGFGLDAIAYEDGSIELLTDSEVVEISQGGATTFSHGLEGSSQIVSQGGRTLLISTDGIWEYRLGVSSLLYKPASGSILGSSAFTAGGKLFFGAGPANDYSLYSM